MDSNVYAQQSLSDLVKVPKWDLSQTRQVVRALADSGLSIREFSQANGMGYWRVMNAKRRLNTKTRRTTVAVARPALVPVTVRAGCSTSIAWSERWVLEVDIGGCMVRVSKDVNEQTLATTLRAVRGLSC